MKPRATDQGDPIRIRAETKLAIRSGRLPRRRPEDAAEREAREPEELFEPIEEALDDPGEAPPDEPDPPA